MMIGSEGRYGLERGLVGWWRLRSSNEGVNDIVGNNNGILSGDTAYSYSGEPSAPDRRFVEFDGSNDYITIPSGWTGLLGYSAFTYSCWINQDNTNDAIFFDRNMFAGPDFRTLFLYRFANNIRVTLYGRDGVDNVDAETYFPGTVMPAASWTHFCVTWDKNANGGAPHCYCNGTEVSYTANATLEVDLRSSPAVTYIGMYSNGSAYPFNGKMSDLRIYNRALSEAEVARLAKIY